VIYAYKNEQGTLCCALFKENIPAGTQYVSLDCQSDDVYLEGGEIKVKTSAQKDNELLLSLRQKAHEKNSNVYKEVYSVTDNEYLKYQKRQVAGILTEQDEADIQQAITAYAEATALYRTMKDAIDSMTITELQHYMEA